MRPDGRALLRATVLVLAMLPAAAAAQERAPIVVGSKNFTENRLLGEVIAQLLEARTALAVERRLNLGGTTVVFSALRSGQIDIYPEYTGTAWVIHLGIGERVGDPLRAFLRVEREFADRWDVAWLQPFGFSNSYALAMDAGVARELGIRRVSDLLAHVETLQVAVSHEFLSRDDGFPGLTAAYGLEFPDLRGMEHGLAYEALRSGRVDLIDTWTTDGKLLRYDITLLEDDRAFFPPYDAAPIVRGEILRRHPEIRPLLEELAFRIDAAKMRTLNARVEDEGGSFEQVASGFLAAEGLIDAAGQPVQSTAREDEGFLRFLWGRRGETARLAVQHMGLTAVGVALAVLLAVPLGVLLTRRERAASAILSTAGVIQTIPSLALLAFMIPIPALGLGARSAIAALFLYALLPVLRNTYTGIREVDADLLDAARGMGMRDRDVLMRVEIPLATRTIMAGVRTATVISIGIATLAAFIGAGGLGDPIVTGLQLNDPRLILAGAIPAAALAVVVDALLGGLERWLAPLGLD